MKQTSTSRRPNSFRTGVLVVIGVTVTALVTSSCTGVRFEAQSTAAQDACRDYAQALIDGGSREAVTAGMEGALSTARSDPSSEAQAVADAIEALLTQSGIGTNESVLQANDAVIRACESAGVTLEMTE